MNVAFIHQGAPGQFGRLAQSLAADPANKVLFITGPGKQTIPNIRIVRYRCPPDTSADMNPWLMGYHQAVKRGRAVAETLLRLKRSGFVPDIVVAHAGWGESLFVKDVLPLVPVLTFCEFYYRSHGSDMNFHPDEKLDDNELFRIRLKNSTNIMALESCDAGMSPTHWQHRQYPARYRSKISVIHDGIDTEAARPDAAAVLDIGGLRLDRSAEVVTFVNRTLEPYRGFPTFLHAMERLQKQRPNTHFVLIGGEDGGYGRKLPDGSYKSKLLEHAKLDMSRTHFLGRVPYKTFINVLQVSSVHVYLTRPFVLSWSMLEAMAAECVVIGSRTPPVTEVIRDEENGLLVDFFSPEEVAESVTRVLDDRAAFVPLAKAARRTVLERYRVQDCHRQQLDLMNSLIRAATEKLQLPPADPVPAAAPAPALATAGGA